METQEVQHHDQDHPASKRACQSSSPGHLISGLICQLLCYTASPQELVSAEQATQPFVVSSHPNRKICQVTFLTKYHCSLGPSIVPLTQLPHTPLHLLYFSSSHFQNKFGSTNLFHLTLFGSKFPPNHSTRQSKNMVQPPLLMKNHTQCSSLERKFSSTQKVGALWSHDSPPPPLICCLPPGNPYILQLPTWSCSYYSSSLGAGPEGEGSGVGMAGDGTDLGCGQQMVQVLGPLRPAAWITRSPQPVLPYRSS